MSELLKPLDVVDNRTELEKLDKVQACGYCLMARGEWTGPVAHWLVNETSACDADILRIAKERNGEWLLPALVDIAERNVGQMVKLETPIPCELHLICQEEQKCAALAHWRASGFAECDECISQCLALHPDSYECLAPALADIQSRQEEMRERRRQFFAAMRRPEMRMLRAALRDLKHDRGITWESITELEIYPPLFANDCWFVMTDHYQQVCLWPEDADPSFLLIRIHDHDCDVCHPKQEASA